MIYLERKCSIAAHEEMLLMFQSWFDNTWKITFLFSVQNKTDFTQVTNEDRGERTGLAPSDCEHTMAKSNSIASIKSQGQFFLGLFHTRVVVGTIWFGGLHNKRLILNE